MAMRRMSGGGSFMMKSAIGGLRRASSKNRNGNEGQVKMDIDLTALIPAGAAVSAAIQKMYEYAVYGRHAAKPAIKNRDGYSINFEIPAHGLKKSEIEMHVDPSNRFVMSSLNPDRPYKQSLKLPRDGNFEKATFKVVKLELGLVDVTVTNLARWFFGHQECSRRRIPARTR